MQCWINVPGLIYLIMCPRFNRTRNFAHPYWLCGINIIYLVCVAASVVMAGC